MEDSIAVYSGASERKKNTVNYICLISNKEVLIK